METERTSSHDTIWMSTATESDPVPFFTRSASVYLNTTRKDRSTVQRLQFIPPQNPVKPR